MQAQPTSVATRNGVIAGVILGILSLPVITLSEAGRVAALGGGLRLLFLLVALVVFAVAGFTASRRNGLLRSGVWAGFLAALITTFIAVCLGVVILTLMAPSLGLVGAAAARRGGRVGPAALVRLAFVRLFLSGLALLLGGLLAGLIGGLLGRIGRPRGAAAQAAPYAAYPGGPQTQAYAPPPPAQGYAGGYTPPPADYAGGYAPTPQPYYPPTTPYDSDAPTTVRDS